MIQVRNVPDTVHRSLKAKAALAGKSLTDWILDELETLATLPTEEELLARLRDAEPFAMSRSSTALIRKDRDAA
jgi:plasmid stability protein